MPRESILPDGLHTGVPGLLSLAGNPIYRTSPSVPNAPVWPPPLACQSLLQALSALHCPRALVQVFNPEAQVGGIVYMLHGR